MNKTVPLLIMAAAMTLTAFASSTNPLGNLEQVEPAAVTELPRAAASVYPAAQVERGRYLATLLGCGSCHTDGALIGTPNSARLLAGSGVGIATSNPMKESSPGVVYPPNLTPDPKTGIGEWSLDEIATMLQSGVKKHGGQALSVMPWLTFSQLMPQDATAIAAYLKACRQ